MSNVTTHGQHDLIVLLLGAAMVASCIAIAHFAPDTFRAAYIQMRVLTSLGGALLGTALPGLIGIDFKGVRAIGAASFVVLFFLFTPLDMASKREPETAPKPVTETRIDAVKREAPAEEQPHYQNSPVCRGDNCQQDINYNQQRTTGER